MVEQAATEEVRGEKEEENAKGGSNGRNHSGTGPNEGEMERLVTKNYGNGAGSYEGDGHVYDKNGKLLPNGIELGCFGNGKWVRKHNDGQVEEDRPMWRPTDPMQRDLNTNLTLIYSVSTPPLSCPQLLPNGIELGCFGNGSGFRNTMNGQLLPNGIELGCFGNGKWVRKHNDGQVEEDRPMWRPTDPMQRELNTNLTLIYTLSTPPLSCPQLLPNGIELGCFVNGKWVRKHNDRRVEEDRPLWRPANPMRRTLTMCVSHEADPWVDPHHLELHGGRPKYKVDGSTWRIGGAETQMSGFGAWASTADGSPPLSPRRSMVLKAKMKELGHSNWVPTCGVLPKTLASYEAPGAPIEPRAEDTRHRTKHASSWLPGGAAPAPFHRTEPPPPPPPKPKSRIKKGEPRYGPWRGAPAKGEHLTTPASLGGAYLPPRVDPYIPGGAVLRKYEAPREENLIPDQRIPDPRGKPRARRYRSASPVKYAAPKPRPPRRDRVYYNLDLEADDEYEEGEEEVEEDRDYGGVSERVCGEEESEEVEGAVVYPEGASSETGGGVEVQLVTYRRGHVITGMAMRVLRNKLEPKFIPTVSALVEFGTSPGALRAESALPDKLPAIVGRGAASLAGTTDAPGRLSPKRSTLKSSRSFPLMVSGSVSGLTSEPEEGVPSVFSKDRAEAKPMLLLPSLTHPSMVKALQSKLAAGEAERKLHSFKATPAPSETYPSPKRNFGTCLTIPEHSESAPVSPVGPSPRGGGQDRTGHSWRSIQSVLRPPGMAVQSLGQIPLE
eukprot:gene3248-13271_t